ncbi:MAG: methyltransferase domain-containing protein [Anaerolineae bacterium]|nr:methyltransferase domain-containing protein [Anaerolineae bacterium]
MPLKPHSPEWYDRLATLQRGYYYPWRSLLPALNGEDVFLSFLSEIVSPAKRVLEVGCGHGELALQVASSCQSIVAYDRVPDYIQLAQVAAAQQQVHNVTFICADSSVALNGTARIPADDHSVDVIYSRRGPLHWIDEARRVARPNAVLFQLNPAPPTPPSWNHALPEQFQLSEFGPTTMEQTVRQRLGQNGLAIHSCWSFQVQEIFPTPEDLYTFITWGHDPAEVPPFTELAPSLEQIFHDHAASDGLEVPFGRFLWKAIMR